MADLLKKIEDIPYHPGNFMGKLRAAELKGEVLNDIEELAKEVNYRKDQIKILLSSALDEEELKDTLFKLNDLKVGMESRKQHWGSLVPHADAAIKLEIDKVMDMLISTTTQLEEILEEALTYTKP